MRIGNANNIVGLTGKLIDPHAGSHCIHRTVQKQAGIRVKMITGDHAGTSAAPIAVELGLTDER